jgi:hypothetical protein
MPERKAQRIRDGSGVTRPIPAAFSRTGGELVGGRRPGPLGEHLGDLAELSEEDRSSLLNVLDGLVAKSRLKALVGGIS